MSNFENMSKEQQQYTLIASASKEMYEARALSKELQDLALTPNTDPLVVAQTANEMGRKTEDSAKKLYAVRMQIEQEFPHFKEQAKAHVQQQEQSQEVNQEQNQGFD